MVQLLIANAIAFVFGPVGLAVSPAATAAIIVYDYRLKYDVSDPFAMGAARFLKMMFGASPVLLYINNHSFAI